MLLQFLRTSLEMIDDSAWSSQISLELSWQMAGYASPSKEKSFLYKALGTSLAACQDLVHVKSQIHTLLTTADYMEAPERQGVVSILAVCAASHLDLTLKALQEFGAAMSQVKISGFVSHLKRLPPWDKRQDSPHPDADIQQRGCHAPKEQLLSRVEADITRNIIHHYRTSCQDMHLKLTLIQNVTEISCAILETRDSQEYEFSYKLELLGYMLTQGTFDRFGSLIGLIAPYSCDSLAMSRQWVVDCISCLLCIQGQSINLGSAEEELRCLREGLTAPDPEALFQASSKMARVVSEYFPSEQATDFIAATLGGLLSASPTCATAAGLWMKIILKECGDAMLDKTLQVLKKDPSPSVQLVATEVISDICPVRVLGD
ncbi:unnamed protein product [Caretta caretta]